MKDHEKSNESLVLELQACREKISELEATKCKLELTEQALLKSEARYKTLTGVITDYIFTVIIEDNKPVQTIHTESSIHVTGYKPQEFEADPFLWINMVAPEDRYAVLKQAEDCILGRELNSIEHRITHKNGSVRWIRSTLVRHYDGDKLVSYDGFLKDVTKEKQAESEIAELARVTDLTPNPFLRITADGKILCANKSSQPIMDGWKTKVNDYVSGYWHRMVSQILKSGKSREIEIDCGSHVFQMTLIPLDNLNIVNFFGHDVTDIKKAQTNQDKLMEDLMQRNKELSDFAWTVAHDLKSPLRGIRSIVDWLQEDMESKIPDLTLDYLNMLTIKTNRMNSLIEGLLKFAKLSYEQKNITEVDLNVVMSQVVEIIDVPEHIELVIEDKMPVVECEEIRMMQVFQNLITNAIKCMDKDKGTIKISCRDEDSHWLFGVEDNGCGIESKHHDRIFQIFASISNSDPCESSGIGLAIVKKIIESYGGRIWVESEPGNGAIFWFTMPKTKLNQSYRKITKALVGN